MVTPGRLRSATLRKEVYGDIKPPSTALTLTVPQGCFFGFLGPNGAGKTTTIKMLMGLGTAHFGQYRTSRLCPMPETLTRHQTANRFGSR